MNVFFEELTLKKILASRGALSRSRSAEGKPLQRLMIAYDLRKGGSRKEMRMRNNEGNYLNLQKKACFIHLCFDNFKIFKIFLFNAMVFSRFRYSCYAASFICCNSW